MTTPSDTFSRTREADVRPVGGILCVQWPRLGPYHMARLAATHDAALQRNAALIALETAGSDTTYQWNVESGRTPFRREVIFEDQTYENLHAQTIHRGVTATLDRLQPDAVAITSYSTPDARACLLWCKRRRRVAILMSATKEDDADRVYWRERVKAMLVRLYDAALVGGTPQQQYLEKLGFPRAYIFQGCDAVDNDFFRRRTRALREKKRPPAGLPGLDDTASYFLASNRFIQRKNLERLILAYEAYRSQSPAPWRLLLLGDGPVRPDLERLVEKRAVEGVVFCGFRQLGDLPAYYAFAGAFVHPALNDQWGLVVNEAMASGLPVLVSRRAGCAPDLVEHQSNGYVFDPTDTDSLTRCLSRMASPETCRSAMGEASQRIVARWSTANFAENMWRAVEKGRDRTQRALYRERAVLWSIQRLSRQVHSFHSVES